MVEYLVLYARRNGDRKNDLLFSWHDEDLHCNGL